MDKAIAEKINAVATATATELGLVILHFTGRGTDMRPVVEITLDGDHLVSVEDCERVSRRIQDYIDEHLGENVNYRLDVLSPGVDEPIIYDYQLTRSIGRTVKVRRRVEDKETDVTGILRSFSAAEIEIEQQKQITRGQAPKSIGIVTIERSTILGIQQLALIR